MKNYITSSKKKSTPPSSVLFSGGAVNTIFFNEIGDYEKNEIPNELYLDLRRKGFVEIAYSYYSEDDFNSNNNDDDDDNEENYFIYFYNKNGDMIFAKRIPLLKKKDDEEQNGSIFVSFVPYNNTNASVYAYAIVKEDLINKKQLIQFVSIDDVVTGREGPANGIQSKIFGLHLIPRSLQQDDYSPIQQASFSLVGSGCDPNSFTPIIETRPTPGQINPGQTFTDCRTLSPPLQPNDPPPDESVANTFATTLGNNNSRGGLLGAESFVGIAIAALVVIVALFVGGRKYSTRWRNESEEEEFKYFEGGDDIEAQIKRTTTAPDVPESIPEKLTLSNIIESSSEKIRITSKESNKMDNSFVSKSSHSNVRTSSLISSKDLQYRTIVLNQNPKEEEEEEEVSTILINSDNVGSKTQPAEIAITPEEESVLESKNDTKDDTSASTTTVRAKSLLSSKNLPTLRSTTASIITSVVESNINESKTPVTSDVAVSNKEENEIKPLYGLSEWKIFGTFSQQPSSQQHQQEDDDTISESSSSFIFTKSRSLMSKFF